MNSDVIHMLSMKWTSFAAQYHSTKGTVQLSIMKCIKTTFKSISINGITFSHPKWTTRFFNKESYIMNWKQKIASSLEGCYTLLVQCAKNKTVKGSSRHITFLTLTLFYRKQKQG